MDRQNSKGIDNNTQANARSTNNEAFQRELQQTDKVLPASAVSNSPEASRLQSLVNEETKIEPAKKILAEVFSNTPAGKKLFDRFDTASNWLPFIPGDGAITKADIENATKTAVARGANNKFINDAKLLNENWDKQAFQQFKNSDGEITRQSYERGLKNSSNLLEPATLATKQQKSEDRLSALKQLDLTLLPATKILNGSESGNKVFLEMQGRQDSGLSKGLVKHIAESNPNNPFSYSNEARAVAAAMYKAWEHPDFQALKTGDGVVTNHTFFRGLAENRQEAEKARENIASWQKLRIESNQAEPRAQVNAKAQPTIEQPVRSETKFAPQLGENQFTAARWQSAQPAKEVQTVKQESAAERSIQKPEDKLQDKPKLDNKPVASPEVKPEAKPEVKPEAKPEVKPEAKPEAKPIAAEKQTERTEVNAAAPQMQTIKLGAELGRAAMVRRGEGPYQVAERILSMSGSKPDHKSIMELTRAFQAQYKEEKGTQASWRELKVNHKFLTNENLEKVMQKMQNGNTKSKLQTLVARPLS